jgi:asparagine synthase (glutamine-hydrolysing)
MTNGRQQAVRRSPGDMLAGIDDPVAIMTLRDLLSYLPDDILVKVDRATMSASLESRAPFLDHRIVELGLQLPTELKIADRVGKRVLRAILHKYLPREMFERPKMGFGVPIEHWLRGPLKNWASDLLEEQRLREDALVDASAVTQMLGEHFAGVRNHHHCLWALLSLYAWLDLNSVRP